MWTCRNCSYEHNEDLEPGCLVCDAPRGFDPNAETKILPTIKLLVEKPCVGNDNKE